MQHQVLQVFVHLDGCVAEEKFAAAFKLQQQQQQQQQGEQQGEEEAQQQQQQQQQPKGLQGLCDCLLAAAFQEHEETLQQLVDAFVTVVEKERQEEREADASHMRLCLLYIHLGVRQALNPKP